MFIAWLVKVRVKLLFIGHFEYLHLHLSGDLANVFFYPVDKHMLPLASEITNLIILIKR